MSLMIKKTLILEGKATPPSSKSESIRAIILASLGQRESTLSNVLHSDDTQDAMNVCKHLGAKISVSNNNLKIISNGLPLRLKTTTINSGNSGITTHFVIPILGLRENPEQSIILNCGAQMLKRPIDPLVKALKNLGLNIEYTVNKNTLPIKISGELVGGETEVDGSTSQYLSALLFALPCAKSDSKILVKNLRERPYVNMTLNYLDEQGIQYEHTSSENIDVYKIKGRQKYKNINKKIPNDFSSASYLITASVLIPGEVILQGLNMHDAQGDKQLISLLQKMGADIHIEADRLLIRGGKKLSGIKINANDIPDLVPTLAVIGACASGVTEIENVAHARIKETDRIHSMMDGLTRLGARVIEKEDGLSVSESKLKGNHLKSYGDHRTAMALSIAGMMAEGKTIIDDHQPINKTFPTFIQLMQSLGANMEIENEIIT